MGGEEKSGQQTFCKNATLKAQLSGFYKVSCPNVSAGSHITGGGKTLLLPHILPAKTESLKISKKVQ